MADSFSAEAQVVVEALRAQIAERDALITHLLERVEALESRLGKNSKNSSQPPSRDNPFTKPSPRSLRRPSGRRPGKQPGEDGARLDSVADPDRVRVHVPTACTGCGSDLSSAEILGQQVRQVFDLPPVRLEVTEHRVQTRRCGCGHLTAGRFPVEATAPTCYGPSLAALGAYLMARQHVPVARAAELMADCFGARVSTGWLAGLLPQAQARLEGPAGFARVTRAHLKAAPVAHFDETGARVAGKLWWIHVACTAGLTHYHRAAGRGGDSANLGGVLPGFAATGGVAIHDGLTSYRGYDTSHGLTHGLCNAHHLRELQSLTEAHQRRGLTEITWPQAMGDLLVEINTAVKTAKSAGHHRLEPSELTRFAQRYREVLAEGWKAHPPAPPTGKRGRPKLGTAGSLLRRLDIYQDDVLRFATDFAVPFDNNQAERDIRMIRIQQKISGSWRSEAGADAYLTVRSYLSTARKQQRNSLEVLRDLFTGTAWLPAPT